MQHTATHCNTLQRIKISSLSCIGALAFLNHDSILFRGLGIWNLQCLFVFYDSAFGCLRRVPPINTVCLYLYILSRTNVLSQSHVLFVSERKKGKTKKEKQRRKKSYSSPFCCLRRAPHVNTVNSYSFLLSRTDILSQKDPFFSTDPPNCCLCCVPV